MKATFASLKMLFKHISRDGMLALICAVPLVVLVLLSYVLPTYIEPLLPFDFSRYYLLLDLMVAVMTPYLLCFASAMAMLEEIDNNIAPYLSVTPVGKSGYIFSRLLFPTLISALITILFLVFGSVTKLSIVMTITLSVCMAVVAMITSMIVVCFAKNKVEGMALAKLSGMFIVGIFIPFFMVEQSQYFFGFLPSFWIAKLAISNNYLYVLPIVTCSALWIAMLRRVYLRRQMG